MFTGKINEAECERLYNLDFNDREIAEETGIPATTVASWRKRTNRVCISEKKRRQKEAVQVPQIIQDMRAADELGISYGQYKLQQRGG